MRALRVFLFITFLVYAIFGLLGLFFPALMVQIGVAPPEPYARIAATAAVGFAVALWYAFRNPRQNTAVILAAIVWLGLEALVLLFSGITGSLGWDAALPGVISDAILAAGLAIFYPRGEKAT